VPDYSVRNRVVKPTNPFFITKKGTYMAGVLMANVPGDDKEERINYLAHLFRLAKEEKHLIGTTFTNGNHWFTMHFKLNLDMENCVERINGKNDEDFKIIYLKGGLKKEEQLTSTQESPTAYIQTQDIRTIHVVILQKNYSNKES
jgi:hypothetical protein